MLSNPQLRELTANQIFNRIESNDETVKSFIKYIDAYCAELKCSEQDILLNDETYEQVFGIFSGLILRDHPLV